MAYKTDELITKAIEAIKQHSLYFIEDVVAYLPCSKPTFYEHKLNEVDEIKGLLEQNKITTKVALRKKWRESDNATLQIALYKLIATDEENTRINSQKIEAEHTLKGSGIKIGFADEDNG